MRVVVVGATGNVGTSVRERQGAGTAAAPPLEGFRVVTPPGGSVDHGRPVHAPVVALAGLAAEDRTEQ